MTVKDMIEKLNAMVEANPHAADLEIIPMNDSRDQAGNVENLEICSSDAEDTEYYDWMLENEFIEDDVKGFVIMFTDL